MKLSLLMLIILFISACNDEGKTQAQTMPEPPKAVVKEQVTQVEVTSEIDSTDEINNEPFDFSYKDLSDNVVKLSDFKGKWVVVNFWATWCPPCRKEIPDFVKFKTLYSDKVEILGIDNEDADIEIIRAFAEDYKVNYPILLADVYNPTEFDRQNTMGLPTTVIFNPKGEEVSKRVGPMHFDDLVKVIGIETNSPPQVVTE